MLLALDTSTRSIGVALYDGVQVLSESVWTSSNFHTVELAPKVAETLEQCGVSTDELGALAVAIGPGSFTGLRIGLGFGKGLSLAQHIPLIGIPTLDILASAQPVEAESLVAVLRAGRGRLAASWYQLRRGMWQSSGKIETLTAEELGERIQKPTQVCGELTKDEQRLLGRKRKIVILASPAQSLRRPAYLAELGWKRWQKGEVDNPAVVSPFYLHTGETIPGG